MMTAENGNLMECALLHFAGLCLKAKYFLGWNF